MKLRSLMCVALSALIVLLSSCGIETTVVSEYEPLDAYSKPEGPTDLKPNASETPFESKTPSNADTPSCKDQSDHKYTQKVVAPTCTKKGYTLYTCKICKASYKDNYVSASHSWGEWVVTRKPTATNPGSKYRTCKSCDKKSTTEIPQGNSVNYSELQTMIYNIPSGYEDFVDGSVAYNIQKIKEDFHYYKDIYSQEEIDMLTQEFKALISIDNINIRYKDISQIFITSKSNINQEAYCDASISVVDASGNVLDIISDKKSQIKIRGNSTANASKPPYNIKFSTKQDVLGMGAAKKWSLLSNPFDTTMLRCAIASRLAQDIGLEATSDYRYVEVWLNEKYMGVYTVFESIEDGPTRVDISVDDGDFIIEREYERTESDKTYITTKKHNIRFKIKEPSKPTETQIKQLEKLLEEAEEAIASRSYSVFSEKIDIESFINYYIVNELFAPLDFGSHSEFFYFKDGILYAGPVWDYDLSSGNLATGFNNGYDFFKVKRTFWYYDLFHDTGFLYNTIDRYKEVQKNIINLYANNELGKSQIDIIISSYAAPIERNFEKWDINYHWGGFQRVPDKSYYENVNHFKRWLNNRNNWLLENIK